MERVNLGVNRMGIVNRGLIDADIGRLSVDPGDANVDGLGSDLHNTGVLRASNGGFLRLENGTFRNDGQIEAISGGVVELDRFATVVGGTLTTDANPGSAIVVTQTGVVLDDVTNTGRLTINNSFDPVLTGTITNNGTVVQNDLGSLTDIRIEWRHHSQWKWDLDDVQQRQTTVGSAIPPAWKWSPKESGHTIEGRGRFGFDSLGLHNRGSIIANHPGRLTIDPSDVDLGQGADVVNDGIMEAQNGGTLALEGGLFHNNTTLRARNDSFVALRANAHVRGGTFATNGSGRISVEQQGVVLEDVTLASGSQMQIANSFDPVLQGTLTNLGNVLQTTSEVSPTSASQGMSCSTEMARGRCPIAITTAGWVTETEPSSSPMIPSIRFVASDNSVLMPSMSSTGVPSVPNSGTLTLDPSDGTLGPQGDAGFVNQDLLQAANGGTLRLQAGRYQNNDTIQALDASMVVLASGVPRAWRYLLHRGYWRSCHCGPSPIGRHSAGHRRPHDGCQTVLTQSWRE